MAAVKLSFPGSPASGYDILSNVYSRSHTCDLRHELGIAATLNAPPENTILISSIGR